MVPHFEALSNTDFIFLLVVIITLLEWILLQKAANIYPQLAVRLSDTSGFGWRM